MRMTYIQYWSDFVRPDQNPISVYHAKAQGEVHQSLSSIIHPHIRHSRLLSMDNPQQKQYPCDFEACGKHFPTSRGLNAHQKIHLKPPSKGPTAFKFVDSQKGLPPSTLDPALPRTPGTLPSTFPDRCSRSWFAEMSSSPVGAAGSNPGPLPDLMTTLLNNVSKKRQFVCVCFIVTLDLHDNWHLFLDPVSSTPQEPSKQASPRTDGVASQHGASECSDLRLPMQLLTLQ